MNTPAQKHDSTSQTWRIVWRIVAGLFVVALLAGFWIFYSAVSVAIKAEENLHATIFVIRLVEQFAIENDRWPSSWDELEQIKFPGDAPMPANGELGPILIGGAHGYQWPSESPHLQKCVQIDFGVNADSLVNQDPMDFQAIKPIGPCYQYRDYGFVQSLQQTLAQCIEKRIMNRQDPPRNNSNVYVRLCHPAPRHDVKDLRQSTRDSTVTSSLTMTSV